MVEDYKILVEPLKEKGVILFAVLKMDDLTDRWTLVFSAENMDDVEKRRELFTNIIKLATEDLTPELRADVARFGIFPKDDKIVLDLLKQEPNKSFKNIPANGSFIHEGMILIPDEPLMTETSAITTKFPKEPTV